MASVVAPGAHISKMICVEMHGLGGWDMDVRFYVSNNANNQREVITFIATIRESVNVSMCTVQQAYNEHMSFTDDGSADVMRSYFLPDTQLSIPVRKAGEDIDVWITGGAKFVDWSKWLYSGGVRTP